MQIVRLSAAALIGCALAPAGAGAAPGQPPFPQRYRGTITGTLAARDSSKGTTAKASWTIKGVVLRRARVMKSDADWSAIYKVTGGKIVYHEAETGACSYTFDTTLPLRTSLDSTSAPFALSQSFFFNRPTHALGLMNVRHGYKVTETCPQPDGEPTEISKHTLQLPTLFDPGEKIVKLGKRFAAHNSSVDDFGGGTTIKWSWVLKPAR